MPHPLWLVVHAALVGAAAVAAAAKTAIAVQARGVLSPLLGGLLQLPEFLATPATWLAWHVAAAAAAVAAAAAAAAAWPDAAAADGASTSGDVAVL